MSLIDIDLLSIQEAHVLLERAESSQSVLEGLSATLVDDFLNKLAYHVLPKAQRYAELAFQESDYGDVEDETELTRWVLTDLLAEVFSGFCARAQRMSYDPHCRGGAV